MYDFESIAKKERALCRIVSYEETDCTIIDLGGNGILA